MYYNNYKSLSLNFFVFIFSLYIAPAIRVIDEQGHEVRDRYYKIGSTIELSCQVATSYVINSSSSTPEPNGLLQYPVTPSIKQNLIDYNGDGGPSKTHKFSSSSSSSSSSESKFYKRIIWRKDGEKLIGDAIFNIRYNNTIFILFLNFHLIYLPPCVVRRRDG